MRFTIAVGLRACACAGALFLAAAHAAEQRPVAIGATKAQILSRYGEPRSVMVAGNREIMWFARERMVLRDGIVVEVEPLATEPVRPAKSAPAPAAETGVAPATVSAEASSPQPDAAAPSAAEPAGAPDQAQRPVVETPAPPEPVFTIKSVRPPTSGYVRTEPQRMSPAISETAGTEPSTSSAPPVSQGAPLQPGALKVPRAVQTAAPDSSPTAAGTASDTVQAGNQAQQAPDLPALATKPAEMDPTFSLPEMAPPQDAPAKQSIAEQKTGGDTATPKGEADADGGIAIRTYAIVLLVLLGGGGFFFWRSRQRQLEMAATALSHAPFSAPARTGNAAQFTTGLLEKLEWRRFEELVASYYGKTGVVAVRTKSGPGSPVHIKISWKGEPRPFACVQCIAHPAGLIDVKPVQELFDSISAEDIRRGYVVSTGKFSVAARDFAEERHLTLMAGEILLDKLNALPDAARAELMDEVTAGDCTTPSCPKCESKMERSPGDASVWRCPEHHDVTFPVRN